MIFIVNQIVLSDYLNERTLVNLILLLIQHSHKVRKLRKCVYHTPVPILRLRINGIARPCIYFDITSLPLYKHSVKTR
jgi:hypothetical protein